MLRTVLIGAVLGLVMCRGMAVPLAFDFETSPEGFVPPPDKQPMVLSTARAHGGESSYYSGPPANLACAWRHWTEPQIGRVEVWFYDDLLPAKRQTVALALEPEEQALMFVCTGGTVYQSRIGQQYSDTAVRRSAGWRRLTFEVGLAGASLRIDGTLVRENPDLHFFNRIMLGSPWDDSRGWYDDLVVDTRTPTADELAHVDRAREAALLSKRQELQALAPRLQSDWRPSRHVRLGPVTPMAAEYHRRLLRYVRYLAPDLHEVRGHPGWQYHKVDHSQEHSVRQNATVALCFATLLQDRSAYDASEAGVSRTQLKAAALALVRYLAYTHLANGWPTGDGKSWGDHWQSALWARSAGHAAWLLWDDLEPEAQVAVARMVEHEADRFNSRPPDSGADGDTKAEENAWNSMLPALAGCMFPHHPRAKLWRRRAEVYELNSFVRPEDRTSDRLVDGRPARERISAVTLKPDYSLENHNRVHPDYLGCIGLLLTNALVYEGAGRPRPEANDFNVPECWRLLAGLIAPNGSAYYINGQDWWPHRHDWPLSVADSMAVLHHDANAARVAQGALQATARLHSRFDNGRLWAPEEINYPNAEEEMAVRYAELYLLHRLFGDGPPAAAAPRPPSVLVSEPGGFVLQRLDDRTVSFSWRNGAMGLIWPGGVDDTWFTSPNERGLVGHIDVAGLPDQRPLVQAHHIAIDGDQLAITAVVSRCGGTIRQELALVSLPGHPVVYLERLVALADVTVNRIATGWLPVFNEPLPTASPNLRRLAWAGGVTEVTGACDRPEHWLTELGRWANLDQRFGAVTSSGEFAYWDNNAWRGARLEEALVAQDRAAPLTAAPGQTISRLAVAILPQANAAQTQALSLDWEPGDELAVRCGGFAVRAVPEAGLATWSAAQESGARRESQDIGAGV